MKKVTRLMLLVALACAAANPQQIQGPGTPQADRHALPASFVLRQGMGFAVDDRPFYFSGGNCYYLMVYAADPLLRPAVDEVLDDSVAMGLRVIRTWAFNDGAGQWNALQTSPGVYQEYVFQGLDYVIAEAGRRGLRLILPLVNNWGDYGGMDQYVQWSSTANRHDDFYTDADCRQWYKDHVRKILKRRNTFTGIRYRDDPTILGWELANEPRCATDASGNVLQGWVEEMSAFLKGVDSRHLLTTGSEGFYGPNGPRSNPHTWMAQQGVDFVRNHSVPEIDFATLHLWPEGWNLSLAQSTQWISDHAADAGALLNRPMVVEEFGKSEPLSVRDSYFQAWYDAIYSSASAAGAAAGSCFWILYHDTYQNYDGFGVYYPAHSSTVAIISAEANRMNGL
jgi:mannan endo-1,4-beta-mannosidase